MDNLMHELERTCERTTKELHDLNDRLEQNKNSMSPADLDILFKLMDVVKDIKSTIKKIYEIEDMEGSDEYSGSYYADPMMDRRYPNRYSGNSYRGTYTVESGNGYSGRRMGRHYSRNTERDDLAMRLENMLTSTRSKEESDAIRKAIDILEA